MEASAYPQYYVPIYVINEGESVPTSVPAGTIIFSRAAAATITPTVIAQGPATSTTEVALVTTQDVSVGDYLIFNIYSSGEPTLPTTYTYAYSAGAGAVTNIQGAEQAGTVQTNMAYARCTTAIPTGTTITITANQIRAQMGAVILKSQNLAATSVIDQSGAYPLGNSSNPSVSVGPLVTTQANELAVMAFGYNPGSLTEPLNREVTGTNGWTQLGDVFTAMDTDATQRSIAVFYRELAATTSLNGTLTVTYNNGATDRGASATVMATFKAA